MADKEKSEFIPNSFQTPNVYVDRYLHLLEPQESVVLIYTVRRIFGFNQREARISLNEYARGRKKRNGDVMDNGTGIRKATIMKILATLIEFGFIIEVAPSEGNQGPLYSLQLDDSKINHEAINSRNQERYAKNLSRLKNATEKRLKGVSSDETQGSTSHETLGISSDETQGGTSDETLSGTSDGTQGGTSDGTLPLYSLNTLETQEETHTETQRAGARESSVCVSEISETPTWEKGLSRHSEEVIHEYRLAHPEIKSDGWEVKAKELGLYDDRIDKWLAKKSKQIKVENEDSTPEFMQFHLAMSYVQSVSQYTDAEGLSDYIATMNVSAETREKLRENFMYKVRTFE